VASSEPVGCVAGAQGECALLLLLLLGGFEGLHSCFHGFQDLIQLLGL
jgi:hypothetical protein